VLTLGGDILAPVVLLDSHAVKALVVAPVLSLLCVAAAPALRAESFASSASSAGSASSGSLSDSVQGSSESSTGNNRVAEGEYRVIEVADVADRPQHQRLRLEALRREGDAALAWFTLDLPRQTVAAQGLGAGHVVAARHRPYGLEFAHARTRQPFFLALVDDWQRELAPRPIGL
jgi:hypothetical protein